jgi:hypothetical protein
VKYSTVAFLIIIAIASVAIACTKNEESSQTATSAPTTVASAATAAETAQIAVLSVAHFKLASAKASMSGNETKTITTAAQPYYYAAYMMLPSSSNPPPGFVMVRLKVTKGEVGVGILDQSTNKFSARQFVSSKDGIKTLYLPLDSTLDPRQLIVENGRFPGVSQAVVQAVQIVSQKSQT